MAIVADRVKETTTTTGTGTVNLGGAVTGFQAFSAAFASGTLVYYCITDGTNWEVGSGTATTGSPWTLSRSTVLASSNAGALVSFGAGSKDVFCTAPASGMANPNLSSINSGQLAGARNDLINPEYLIAQLYGTGSATITAGAAINYSIDRWYTQSTGQNITAQRITTGVAPYGAGYKLSAGATGPTTTLHGQRIESINCGKYVNNTVAVQVGIICDTARTVTWTAYYANTADVFSAKTQIATGTISATTTLTTYYFSFNGGANAANGICIEYTTGTLTNSTGYVTYTGHQLEKVAAGITVGSSFEFNSKDTQYLRCQRYFYVASAYLCLANGAGAMIGIIILPTLMRATPTAAAASTTGGNGYTIPGVGSYTTTVTATVQNFAPGINTMTVGQSGYGASPASGAGYLNAGNTPMSAEI